MNVITAVFILEKRGNVTRGFRETESKCLTEASLLALLINNHHAFMYKNAMLVLFSVNFFIAFCMKNTKHVNVWHAGMKTYSLTKWLSVCY